MSIFRCTQCGMVDNTAISGYWSWVHHYPEGATDASQMVKRPALCSQCNPEIGKWHGEFERFTPESQGYVEGPDGFLYSPDDKYLKEQLEEKAKKAAKPIGRATATLLGMAAALAVDAPTRDESIPRGYRCTVCRQQDEHGRDCSRPRGLELLANRKGR